MDEPNRVIPDEIPAPNPKRVAAGLRNRRLRGQLTDAGRFRLREAALRNRPWQFSTGPKTAEGRQQSARNGKKRQSGELSARQLRVLFGFLISHLGPLKTFECRNTSPNRLKTKRLHLTGK